MKIKRISVKNFKCFSNIDININDFNVVIGKNASGKSNFINIFKFINDILTCGIDDAIAIQGGINYICNSKIGRKKNIELKFSVEIDEEYRGYIPIIRRTEDNQYAIKLKEYDMEVQIRPNQRGNSYKIVRDLLRLKYILLKAKEKKKRSFLIDDYDEIKIFYQECLKENELKDYKEKFDKSIPDSVKEEISILDNGISYKTIKRMNNRINNSENQLLINIIPLLRTYNWRWNNNLVTIYDFDSKILKNSSMINQKNALDEDGSNIPNILQRILKNPQQKKELLLLLKEVLPFISNIEVESNFNKSLYFKINENNSKTSLPSYLLSDGTVNIVAIIIALYFQNNRNTVIIEEPEKNMHPKLAQQIVRMMKDNSKQKQLIITTHSTHLLSAIELEDIIYVYRSKEGFSNVLKPKENEKVKSFIANELEIGDLFYDSLFVDEEA